MRAIRRLVAGPWVWLSVWLLQVCVAWMLAAPVYGAVAATMRQRAWLDDGHRLFAVAELFADHPAVVSVIVTAVVSASVLSVVLWIVASGGVITRLAGLSRGREALADTARFLPEIAVQSAYGMVGRAVLLGLGGVLAAQNTLAGIVALAVLLPLSAFAADAARVLAIFVPESRYHPRLYWRALVTTLRSPVALLLAVLFTLLQLAAAAAILYLGVADSLGPNTLPGLRVLASVPLFFALCRVALAIETFVPPASPGEVETARS
jgi:hypothetical protein